MLKLIQFKELQRDLDTLIHTNKKIGMVYSDEQINKQMRIACWVELGELANEIEFFKYWKGNKRNDKEKQLFEFADVMHFLLSLMNIEEQKTFDVLDLTDVYIAFKMAKKMYPTRYTLTRVFDKIMKNIIYKDYENALIGLCQVMFMLEFDPLELELAYLGKNKVNIKRQNENY